MKRSAPITRSSPLRMSGPATTRVPAFKPKTCPAREGGCGQKFTPSRQMQKMCGPECAISHAGWLAGKKAAQAAKDDRKATREQLEALKTLPTLAKECEREMNRYVRLRDWHLGCISCGKQFDPDQIGGSCDAGHYRSKGSAMHLRFDERNLHGQCKHCNDYLAGNPIGYRAGLILRHGLEMVEALECDQTPRKYSRSDLREKRDHYRAKANALAKMRNVRQQGNAELSGAPQQCAIVAVAPQKVLLGSSQARGRGAAEIDSFSPPMGSFVIPGVEG